MSPSCTGHTLAALLTASAALPASAAPLLNPVFGDHAVLQREAPIRIWGEAAPGARITASMAGKTAAAKADKSGHWQAVLPALTAGGPYELTVQSGAETQTLRDVLIGDVYLCSGQSNMAYRVAEAIDAGPEIAQSANNNIRLVTIATATNPAPLGVLPKPASWSLANPKDVANFSAACYFFGRELQKSVNVPLGLIHSAWPGANITAFMSAQSLSKAGLEAARIETLKLYAKDPKAAVAKWGGVIEGFWKSQGVTPWSDSAVSANWREAPKNLGVWSSWGIADLANFAGHVWFRTTITLTAAEAEKASTIAFGPITEEDQTWINGKWLAGSFGYGQPRNYDVPKGLLHEGSNDILINVYCGWRGCGLAGPAAAQGLTLSDGTKLAFSAPWKYQPVPVAIAAPRIPWGATAGITMAYNAMIAPLAPYNLKGVLWYQGESNTGEPEAYRGLLKAWMEDWRSAFKTPELPFLIVQLPDYGLPPFAPENGGWARLRESQRLAVAADPHAALAVTIDIGDHMGLHPSNKQEVGRRLALAARRLVYHDAAVKSGPLPQSTSLTANTVTVRFSGVDGSLKAVSSAEPIGFELCAAEQSSCRFVTAKITGDAVALAIPEGLKPTRVRFCWADGPVCNLYDAARIPAVPFELPLVK